MAPGQVTAAQRSTSSAPMSGVTGLRASPSMSVTTAAIGVPAFSTGDGAPDVSMWRLLLETNSGSPDNQS